MTAGSPAPLLDCPSDTSDGSLQLTLLTPNDVFPGNVVLWPTEFGVSAGVRRNRLTSCCITSLRCRSQVRSPRRCVPNHSSFRLLMRGLIPLRDRSGCGADHFDPTDQPRCPLPTLSGPLIQDGQGHTAALQRDLRGAWPCGYASNAQLLDSMVSPASFRFSNPPAVPTKMPALPVGKSLRLPAEPASAAQALVQSPSPPELKQHVHDAPDLRTEMANFWPYRVHIDLILGVIIKHGHKAAAFDVAAEK